MDRITTNMLETFVNENSLQQLSEDKAFEHFSGYLLTSEHYTDSFSTFDLIVGSGGDTGIDAICIIVNGTYINDISEIEDLLEVNGYLDASFIFIQSERSSNFDMQKIGQFGFGVVDFFDEKPKLKHNDDVRNKFEIMNTVYERSSYFKKGNPKIFLYYVTTGTWVDDANLVARCDGVIEDLSNLSLFSSVKFKCIGAQGIHDMYRVSKNSITREINFPNKSTLPDFDGVEQAYIGFLNAREYLKLIQNDNSEIISSLFYDNVRHWQAWNPVNSEIKKTIEDPSQKQYFPLLNNGVTIVAKRIQPTGNKVLLEDYQIVNGCQTSHVIHELIDEIDDTMNIPV